MGFLKRDDDDQGGAGGPGRRGARPGHDEAPHAATYRGRLARRAFPSPAASGSRG